MRAARYEWRHRRQPRMRLEPHRLVFIDETAVTTKLTRLRGRFPCGARLEADAPFGHWRTQTFIAGLRVDELTAPYRMAFAKGDLPDILGNWSRNHSSRSSKMGFAFS